MLYNIRIGEYVLCHIAGVGFVGVGICTKSATPAKDFIIEVDGIGQPVMNVDWIDKEAKSAIDVESERFIGVKWLRTVAAEDGYWEKGMKSLPMVAYLLDNPTTHDKVLDHFRVELSGTGGDEEGKNNAGYLNGLLLD